MCQTNGLAENSGKSCKNALAQKYSAIQAQKTSRLISIGSDSKKTSGVQRL